MGSSSRRGCAGSTATSPPATRFQTSLALAVGNAVNCRNWPGSAAATVSVRPLADRDARESGMTAWTPRVRATARRTASGIVFVLVISRSAV